MPREDVQWFTKESVHDSEKMRAQQRCTYYSIVNVNKTNYPFSSSYEQAQTWTLTRTISNNHKRYQSSIENIHLTMPATSNKTKAVEYENIHLKVPISSPPPIKPIEYENIKIKKDRRCNSILSSPLLTQKYITSTSLHPVSVKLNSSTHQEESKTLPRQIITKNNFKEKNDLSIRKSRPFNKPMRVIHSNGEFVVRI